MERTHFVAFPKSWRDTVTEQGSTALSTFRRTSTADDVAAAIRAAIVSGEIAQGEQLREATLARQLGVGRAPIREALRGLIQEGLVLYEVHRSASVKVLTAEDVRDIYTAREAIEPVAIELIRADESIDTGAVRIALERLATAETGDKPSVELVEADVRLHETIVRLSGSPRLQRMFQTLMTEWRMYLLHAHPDYPSARYVSDHVDLVEAIASRRSDAPDLMREHLRSSLEVITTEFETPSREARAPGASEHARAP
jgi:DNA-binding GntR family transcriptional regulator